MRAQSPPFKKTVFSNGLTLLSERQTGFRSLSIGVWVNTGTRHEASHEGGICHFIEHMLFKGTSRRTPLDIAREIDRVGGDFNAFTAREDTCFHILLLGRDIRLGVDILTDVLLNSDFSAEEFERERKVILQEIAMVEESPEEMAHDLFFERIFPGHPLGRPILGKESRIRRLTRGELVRFFKKNYRPDRITVAVAGDVEHSELVKLFKPFVRKKWPGRPLIRKGKQPLVAMGKSSPAKRVLAEFKQQPPEVKNGSWWIESQLDQVHLIWGVAGPPISSRDRFAAFLLNIYLGGGMSSSLFQEIREKKGLAYTVYSTFSPMVDCGVFSVYVATGMNQVLLCLQLIEESADKLKRELLSKEELKTIQDNLKGSILIASDDVESRMSSIARNEMFLGQYVSPSEVCRLIDEVTPEDVRRVARKLLKGDERSVLALGPKPTRAVKKGFLGEG